MSLKKNQIQLVFLDLAKSDINNLILDFNLQYDYLYTTLQTYPNGYTR